jgi:putative NADH-flavin reductase
MENNPSSRPLKLLLFGANGGIGKECVSQALAAGHQVNAIVRDPAKLPMTHPNLMIIKGDVTRPESFAASLKDRDLVISAIGHGGGLGNDKPTTLYSVGAENILREMKAAGITRAFFISASALETSPALPPFYRFISTYVIQKLLKHSYADLRRMEAIIKSSDVDWTIVRPPQLTNKPLSTAYRFAVNTYLKNALKVSRAAVAHFMLAHALDNAIYKATIEIAQ